jgi:hypothetical protein
MRQVARTLTVADGAMCRVLICDRDATWSKSVRARLQEAGLRVIQTPYHAPNANAYAERFVRSIKEECLDRLIPFGERHFRRAVAEFVAHYHRERNHQGLGNELIEGPAADASIGRIRRRQRFGGVLNCYAAAWTLDFGDSAAARDITAWRSRRAPPRKAMAVRDRHDFRPLAAFRLPDTVPSLLGGCESAVNECLLHVKVALVVDASATRQRMSFNTPDRTHC